MAGKTFVKYVLVGIVNTAIGLGIIISLMKMGIYPELSNIIGYAVGIVISYNINKIYTFNKNRKSKGQFPKFVMSMLIAYISNITILIIMHRYFGIDKYISTICATISYTIIGYLFSRFYAFK